MRFIRRPEERFLETPHVTVTLLVIINIGVFGLCALRARSLEIASEVLFENGAMYPAAYRNHEYWRLLASGFLHFNAMHIAGNMFCLAIWGAHLEKRVGSLYFIILYLCAIACGAAVSHEIHTDNYLAAGASGGTSGILGALLCLWILGRIDLSAGFFAINFGINVALSYSVPHVDWACHLGGFAAGLILCAGLNVLEKIVPVFLRCKFPEFVKINLFAGLIATGVLLYEHAPNGSEFVKNSWLAIALGALIVLGLIKVIDFALSVRKGLAFVVIMFALANAGLCVLGGDRIPIRDTLCRSRMSGAFAFLEAARIQICQFWTLVLPCAASLVFVLTLLIYRHQFWRGLKDVGFVGATFMGERKRHYGI